MAIELIAKIKPKNNGNFPMVDAEDVAYKEGRIADYMPICLSRAEYEALVAEGNINNTTPYLIREEVVK